MKGVILAGGTGSRLRPATNVTNKHLLPVYDRPMIYFPLQVLVSASITNIYVVTGGELEITDVNNAFIKRGEMTFEVIRGWWTDAGTAESLYRASTLVRETISRYSKCGQLS